MIDLGHRTSLFTAAAGSPATSQELADRAGLSERYVREWLGAMVTSASSTTTHRPRPTAPPERAAASRTADEPRPAGRLNTHLGKHVHQVAVPSAKVEASRMPIPAGVHRRHGRGQPGLLRRCPGRRLPALVPLTEQLRAGVRVADWRAAPGTPWYCCEDVPGVDLRRVRPRRWRHRPSSGRSRGRELTNVKFEVCDAATWPSGSH